MNVKEILKKIAEGKEISKEEKDFLASYDPENADGKIPKERLDREIAKRKEFETKLSEANTALDDLKAKVEEIEAKGMPEKDKLAKESAKLAKQIETLIKERDDTKGEIENMKFSASIAKIAGEHFFTDPEYLGYVVKSRKIAVEDAEAVKSFIGELKTSSPKLFKADAASGSGAPPGGSGNPASSEKTAKYEEAKKKNDVLTMLANAPEIKQDTKKQ